MVSWPGCSMMVLSIKSAVGVGSLLMTSLTLHGAPGTLDTSLKTCGARFGAGWQPAIGAAAQAVVAQAATAGAAIIRSHILRRFVVED